MHLDFLSPFNFFPNYCVRPRQNNNVWCFIGFLRIALHKLTYLELAGNGVLVKVILLYL